MGAPKTVTHASPTRNDSTKPKDALHREDPAFAEGFDHLYDQAWGEGAIPAKYKELTGVSASVVLRCEFCLTWHLQQAAKLGVSKAELVEALRLGLLTGGSPSILTVRNGYRQIEEMGIA